MKTDAEVLLGATIVEVVEVPGTDHAEEGMVRCAVIETVDGRKFTMTGWGYTPDEQGPLVIKKGIHLDVDEDNFRRGERYE